MGLRLPRVRLRRSASSFFGVGSGSTGIGDILRGNFNLRRQRHLDRARGEERQKETRSTRRTSERLARPGRDLPAEPGRRQRDSRRCAEPRRSIRRTSTCSTSIAGIYSGKARARAAERAERPGRRTSRAPSRPPRARSELLTRPGDHGRPSTATCSRRARTLPTRRWSRPSRRPRVPTSRSSPQPPAPPGRQHAVPARAALRRSPATRRRRRRLQKLPQARTGRPERTGDPADPCCSSRHLRAQSQG